MKTRNRDGRKHGLRAQVLSACVFLAALSGVTYAGPGGEAVVVNMVGGASARILDGPVHEGRSKRVGLFAGSSVGETARVQTDRDGQLRMVLSPGAVLCVSPDTSLSFQRLRQTARGLPQREEDLVRRIHISLERGRILLLAGPSSDAMDIRVTTDAGVVQAGGGTFAVAQQPDGSWAVVNEAEELTIIPSGGNRIVLRDKASALLSRDASGRATARITEDQFDAPLQQFNLCEVFFAELKPFFMDPVRFDRAGLAQYIGGAGAGIDFIGGSVVALDVSPSFRPVPVANVIPERPTPGEPGGGGRWGQRRIWDWYNQLGPVKGFNYVPRYAVNSVEMWMEGPFDADIIAEELGWARNAGYTAVRVQLQAVVWEADQDGFIERFGNFLDLAADEGLRVVPVLFDDLNMAGRDPTPDPQPEPEPDRHNAQWVPSPGHTSVVDRSAWPLLEDYVTSVIKAFRRDQRILFWDLYNMAGAGPDREASLPLMDQAFIWAREVEPAQPLAVPAWTLFGSAMTARKLERSDLITFQSFGTASEVDALLMLLRRHDRPIICTDWLLRQRGSDFESILPLFAVHQVGWFNRGLVRGRTQMWVQQEDLRSETDPELWQHDVLREDGDPYRREEVEAIKAFSFEGK